MARKWMDGIKQNAARKGRHWGEQNVPGGETTSSAIPPVGGVRGANRFVHGLFCKREMYQNNKNK